MKEYPVVTGLLPEACDDRLHGVLCCDAFEPLVDLRTVGRKRASRYTPNMGFNCCVPTYIRTYVHPQRYIHNMLECVPKTASIDNISTTVEQLL